MPYRKRYYKRRYNKKRTLSTRNIYANRSAKSQAYQIAALKRRVNYVSRQCKPEVKIMTSSPVSDTFTSWTEYGKYKVIYPTQGTGEDQRIGNSWNVRNCSFRVFINKNYSLSTGQTYLDNGTTYRVIIVQTIAPADPTANIPDITDFLESASNNYQAIVSPFKDGITSSYRILSDVKGSTVSNEKLLNIRYHPYKHESIDPQGFSRIIYMYVLVSTNSIHTAQVNAQHRYVFTDA